MARPSEPVQHQFSCNYTTGSVTTAICLQFSSDTGSQKGGGGREKATSFSSPDVPPPTRSFSAQPQSLQLQLCGTWKGLIGEGESLEGPRRREAGGRLGCGRGHSRVTVHACACVFLVWAGSQDRGSRSGVWEWRVHVGEDGGEGRLTRLGPLFC